jgi:hypothetical protein
VDQSSIPHGPNFHVNREATATSALPVILGHLCTAHAPRKNGPTIVMPATTPSRLVPGLQSLASLMIVATANRSQNDPKMSNTTVVVRLAPH